MDLIDFYFPNSNYVVVTKELNNSHKSYPTVILTHCDILNYDNDATKKEKHKEFLNNHNHILFVDNMSITSSKSFHIDDKDHHVYNKSNYADMTLDLYNRYKDTRRIQTYNMNDYVAISVAFVHMTKNQILGELKKFNNRYIYREFEKNGFCLTNASKVSRDFDQNMRDAEKIYPRTQKGDISQKCKLFLESFILNNMGSEYLGYDFDSLSRRYYLREERKLETYLKRIYVDTQKFSGVRRQRE
jgi:hypothetical protein